MADEKDGKKNKYFWKTHGSVINAMGMKKLKTKKHLRKQSGVSCIRWGPHVATKRVRQLGGGGSYGFGHP